MIKFKNIFHLLKKKNPRLGQEHDWKDPRQWSITPSSLVLAKDFTGSGACLGKKTFFVLKRLVVAFCVLLGHILGCHPN